MEDEDLKKPLYQRVIEANVLGDGNLLTVNLSDIVQKRFESVQTEESSDKNEDNDNGMQ